MTLQQEQDIQKAIQILKSGGVVGLPTETVYGLAANAFNESAVKKIFETKKRPFFDPLIVHISHMSQLKNVIKEFPELPQFISRQFWPGPLTMVLPKSEKVSSLITSGLESVGVRFPKHAMAQKIITGLGFPVAAPSANLFGRTSPTTADHVQKEFSGSVFVADGGACEVGLESTVIGFDLNYQSIKIYRPGAITYEDFKKCLDKFERHIDVLYEDSNVAPGHLKHHYMPSIPLVVLESHSFDESRILNDLKISSGKGVELKLSDDPVLASRELYSNLRKAALSNADYIFVYKKNYHAENLWTAVWDRLQKAATLVLKEGS